MQNEDFERPKLEPKDHAYRLVEDWYTDCKGVLDHELTIPAGFITDGASIPRCLWTICGSPMDNPRIYAAIVHDWLYSGSGEVSYKTRDGEDVTWEYKRKDADKLYRDYQIALGISKFKAYVEYYALRAFGGGHWED